MPLGIGKLEDRSGVIESPFGRPVVRRFSGVDGAMASVCDRVG